jgi:septal ring factor EnvC (AmiA/AmiB activator)
VIWNPWRRAREVQAQLDRVTFERDKIEHALSQSCDRYDKVREMNTQLRDALALYRSR